MRVTGKILLCLFLLLALANELSAKEWRSIIPLHSTRDDVTSLLGQPLEAEHRFARYVLDKEEVEFSYAAPDSFDCLKQLPTGIVLLIKITPKTELLLADLQIDAKKFRKFNPYPSDYPDREYAGYRNKVDGILIRTFKNRVDAIVYMAGEEEYPCPTYYGYSNYFIWVLHGISS